MRSGDRDVPGRRGGKGEGRAGLSSDFRHTWSRGRDRPTLLTRATDDSRRQRRVRPPRHADPRNEAVIHALSALILGVAIALTGARPVAAQVLAEYDYEDLSFRGIGIEVTRVAPGRIDRTAGIGIRADLGLMGPRIRVMPTARYWGSSLNDTEVARLASQIVLVCERQESATCPDTLDLGEVRFSDLELSIDGQFLLLGDQFVAPYLGASLSLHQLNGSGDFIDGTFVEDLLDSVVPGIAALAGTTLRFTESIATFVEARFMLASDVRYASVGIGALWTLPRPTPAAAGLSPVVRR